MKKVEGIWLPDSDTHFKRMMGKEPRRTYHGQSVGCYQYFKIEKVLSLTERRGTALDVGAHVGFWSMWLALEFREVHAFEPVPEHAECFRRNVQDAVELHEHAVGYIPSLVCVNRHPDNSGKSAVGDGIDPVPVRPIDGYRFNDVSLIKIDVEGYESEVLMGAAETIARCRPLIVFEDNGQHERYGFDSPRAVADAVGLKPVCQMGMDWVYQC